MRTNRGFIRVLDVPYTSTVRTVTQLLEKEGFRKVTEVDLGRTVRDDSGEDSVPHLLMGFCNPTVTKQMLSINPELGLLALTGVAVYDTGDGTSALCIDDPIQTLGTAKVPELQPIAKELNRKLCRAYLQTIVAAASSNRMPAAD